jgi:sec-independent protein translocase protein TatC
MDKDMPESPIEIKADAKSQDPQTQVPSPSDTATPAEIASAEYSFASDKMMTVVEHLDELRFRIIRCLIAIGIAFAAALFCAKEIVRALEAPAGTITFQALSLEEPLFVFFKVASYAAIIIALPYVLFEVSQFLSPGLRPQERKVLAPIVIGSPILFVCGALFAYFLVLPPMLHFFGSFGEGVTPIHQRLDFYISLVCTVLLYMGLCFQLPVIIFAISFTGLIGSAHLLKVWRYAVFAAALVAAIITPDPTAISMLIVMAALVALYFLSIAMLKVFGR